VGPRACNVRYRKLNKSIINCTLHLFKDQPENGPTNWAETCSCNYNLIDLIKYKVVYECIIYILYYILAYIQHNGDVSLEKKSLSILLSTHFNKMISVL
jgi:hypothetical protein